jgi:hypothetical protein
MPKAMVAHITTRRRGRSGDAPRASPRVHAGVEGERVVAVAAQPFGGAARSSRGCRNRRCPRPLAGLPSEGAQAGAFGSRGAASMRMFGPVEAAAEDRVIGQAELGADVLDRARVGGRGQRQARHARKRSDSTPEAAVFGPEVVAPLADAMRLVDREERDGSGRAGPACLSSTSRSGET